MNKTLKYNILPYSYQKAKELSVNIYPSDNPKYKIEIYDKNGVFMFYGGSPQYSDFPHYIQSHGKEYADKRRQLYHIRHKKEIEKVGSRGWYISRILW